MKRVIENIASHHPLGYHTFGYESFNITCDLLRFNHVDHLAHDPDFNKWLADSSIKALALEVVFDA